MLRPKPTMQDVADHAGVSLKTVSRVVNREPLVSAELVKRVQASIAALGFVRNEAASRLARGGTMLTFGLVIENISNEFYSLLTKAVEDAAAAHDALVVIGSYEERGEQERMLVDSMYRQGVHAMIIVPAIDQHGWLTEYLARGLNAVFVDRVPKGLPRVDAVLLDNEAGGRLATEHLIAHGHRRIGLVSDEPNLASVHARAKGYRAALRDAGVDVDESVVVNGVFDPVDARKEVGRLLDAEPAPTAFFATNNRATIGILHALRERPRRDIAFVGFDDFALADVFTPGITVVRYDTARLGAAAVQLLLRRIDGRTRRPRRVTIPVELAARGSGEIRTPIGSRARQSLGT